MTRTKSSRALLSVVLAVLMAAAFMPSLTYSSFAATAKKATKVTKASHADKSSFTRTVGTAWTLKYKLSPSKLTSSAKKVVWKSSNSKVAKITTIKSGKAVVSFKKAGSATVTVYTKANKKAKTSWKFKVVNAAKKVAATGVTVKANNSTDYTKTLSVGTVLTATAAPANATGVTYQWYADGTAIDGATSSQFTVTSAQSGKKITVKAKANTGDEVTSAESAAVADATLNGITGISGTAQVGEKLSVAAASTSTGFKDLEDVATIQWYRVTTDVNNKEVETAISGATSATYTATSADENAVLRVKVTPKSGVKALQTTEANWNTDAKAYVLSTATTVQKAATEVAGVAIQVNGKDVSKTDSFKAGTVLTAVVTPAAASSDVDYQWYKDGYKIEGATSATYTPAESGSYSVKATVKSTSTAYKQATVTSTTPATVTASKTFSGVTVTNVTAKNASRTNTKANDTIAVSVSGVSTDSYTAALAKVETGDYGETKYTPVTTTVNPTSDKTAYTMTIPSTASVGDKYVVVLTGTGTNADYGYTSDVLIIAKSSDDTSTLTGYTTTTTGSTSVTLTPATGKEINKDYTVQWYKVTTDSIGVVSNAAISGATGNTYELTTTDAKDTNAKYVAKVTASDGTVAYVYGTKVEAKIDEAIK